MDGVPPRRDGGFAMFSHTTNSSAGGERPSIGGLRLAESERASAHAVTSVVANDRAPNRREERRLLLRYHRADQVLEAVNRNARDGLRSSTPTGSMRTRVRQTLLRFAASTRDDCSATSMSQPTRQDPETL
jgi:hypothetical protein